VCLLSPSARLRQLPVIQAGKLTGQLCEALEAKGLGARQLDLLLYRVDNRIETIRIGTSLPVRDGTRLTRLLCDKIGNCSPPAAMLTAPEMLRQG